MNGVQTRLKCKPNVKRCKRFVFAAHSPLLHPNTLKTKAIIHFQTDHILTRFVFPPLNAEAFYKRLEGQIDAFIDSPHVTGFCYTQLTDVEQEKNGIYYYDRTPKLDMKRIKAIFEKIK